MKLSINAESADALREFAESMPVAIQQIMNSTLKLINTYQSVSETLGVHRQSFYDMLVLIKKTQEVSVDAIRELPKMMNQTADKIEHYIAREPGIICLSQDNSSSVDARSSDLYSSGNAGVAVILSSGHEMIEKFGVAQIKNSTDVFVKGNNFDRFEEMYYAADDYLEQKYESIKEIDIPPSLIEGIHLGKSELEKPELFWSQHEKGGTAESFQKIAAHIPEVRKRIIAGATLNELENDPTLSDCAALYFRDMPKVIKCDGYYEFSGNGRHRILAARALGYRIPVKVIGERRGPSAPSKQNDN